MDRVNFTTFLRDMEQNAKTNTIATMAETSMLVNDIDSDAARLCLWLMEQPEVATVANLNEAIARTAFWVRYVTYQYSANTVMKDEAANA